METQRASSKTILLIDDEDYILQIVEACIDNFSDWRPVIASSGDKGLAAAAQAKPDAILLDMMMPNMDGFTFLKNLKADPRLADIPVVLITARVDLLEPQKLTKLGVKGAIAKPFSAIKIVPEITKILGW